MPNTGAPDPGPALEVDGLVFRHAPYGGAAVLDIARWREPGGSTIGIAGASGSGKTSLLHLLAGIERPTAGSIRWNDIALERLSEAERDRWCRRSLGIIFQDFHLVEGLSAEENVLLTRRFARWAPAKEDRERARALLARALLPDPRRRVERLSRGERQRVALCRALLPRPAVVLADEPTASLDAEAAATVRALLIELTAEIGATLVVASHDPPLLHAMRRRYTLAGGRLEERA